MSKVPFNKACRDCTKCNLSFHTDEDQAYFIKILCNSCEKFGICNKCCRECPRNQTTEYYSNYVQPSNEILDTYTYTVTYTNNSIILYSTL